MEVTPESLCNAWCIKKELNVDTHHEVAPLLYPAINTILHDFPDPKVRDPLLVKAEETYERMMQQYTSLKVIREHYSTFVIGEV